MLNSINNILAHFQVDSILEHRNPNDSMDYLNAVWIDETTTYYRDQIIYMGYASRLPDPLPTVDCGMILINDTKRDFSDFHGELVILQDDSDVAELCILVKDGIFDSMQNVLCSRIAKKLLHMSLSNYSIKETIDFAAEYFHNSILMHYKHGRNTIYYASNDIVEQAYRNTVRSQSKAKPPVTEAYEAMPFDVRPKILEDGVVMPGHRRIAVAVTAGMNSQHILGYLVLYEDQHPFGEEDLLYLALFGRIISQKLNGTGFRSELWGDQFEQNAHDLLNGKTTVVKGRWSKAIGADTQQIFYVALMNCLQTEEFFLNELIYAYPELQNYCVMLLHKRQIVVIANPATTEEREQLLVILTVLGNELGEQITISDRFSQLSAINRAYVQARKLLEYVQKRNLNGTVFDYALMRSDILLSDLNMSEDVLQYRSHDLELLRSVDEAEHTEYLHTLRTYIRCGFNREITRDSLHIHRNPLLYRLHRIEEVLGHSFNDGEYYFNLYLSDKIDTLLERQSNT